MLPANSELAGPVVTTSTDKPDLRIALARSIIALVVSPRCPSRLSMTISKRNGVALKLIEPADEPRLSDQLASSRRLGSRSVVPSRVKPNGASPGRRPESHRPPLTDPNVNLSVHSARAVQSSGRVPQRPVREQIGRPLPDPA